jgi:mono/diheme cytochrome c family protein
MIGFSYVRTMLKVLSYLVNGLGHCGACHTPRNLLSAERANHPLAGGRAEGWDAYALNGASPAPVAWTVESLAVFLQTGGHAEHGVSHGPVARRKLQKTGQP